MRRLVLVLLLAGCSGSETLPVAPIPLRNPTAPVASQADATLARLAGEWVVVEGAGLAPGDKVSFRGQAIGVNGVSLPVKSLGSGRFAVGADAIWVHWLDADNRTVALGDPGGARVWILDRTGRPGERLAAARDILEWYGYDLRRLDRQEG